MRLRTSGVSPTTVKKETCSAYTSQSTQYFSSRATMGYITTTLVTGVFLCQKRTEKNRIMS
eukprot:4196589-Ditylum_brightwellii.AAC.1